MNLSHKNKVYLLGTATALAICLIIWSLGEIILPFIFGVFIAYLLNPVVLKIQAKIKKRSLAVTTLLTTIAIITLSTTVLFGGHIIHDAKRLVRAVNSFGVQNKSQINGVKNSLTAFFQDVQKNETVKSLLQDQKTKKNDLQNNLKNNLKNTLQNDLKKEDLSGAIKSVYSFFSSPEEEKKEKNNSTNSSSWSPLFMTCYSFLYAAFILYSFGYFETQINRFMRSNTLQNETLKGIWEDYKVVFIQYFKQRIKVVVINLVIALAAFSMMDLPGAVIVGILTAMLSSAAHFHYLSLPLSLIGCWVLSIENDVNFLVYLGVLLIPYILISILEELVYFDKIMKSVNAMNPAITMFSFTLWIYVFGGFIGTIIALPLTRLIMIYMDRVLIYSVKQNKDPSR